MDELLDKLRDLGFLFASETDHGQTVVSVCICMYLFPYVNSRNKDRVLIYNLCSLLLRYIKKVNQTA